MVIIIYMWYLRKNKLLFKNISRHIFFENEEKTFTYVSRKNYISDSKPNAAYLVSSTRNLAKAICLSIGLYFRSLVNRNALSKRVDARNKGETQEGFYVHPEWRRRFWEWNVFVLRSFSILRSFSAGSPSSIHHGDATVAGFLTHSFMHLQLFHDAFDVTSWGCARTRVYADVYTRAQYTLANVHTGRLAGGNPTTTFSAFPGSLSSLLFVYTVPLGWLNNVQGQPLQSRVHPFRFPHFSPSATTVPLITLPRTYCPFYFLLLSMLRGRMPRKDEKEAAVDGEINWSIARIENETLEGNSFNILRM